MPPWTACGRRRPHAVCVFAISMACPGINARRVSPPFWLPAPDEQTQRNARVLALNRSEHPTGKMDSYLSRRSRSTSSSSNVPTEPSGRNRKRSSKCWGSRERNLSSISDLVQATSRSGCRKRCPTGRFSLSIVSRKWSVMSIERYLQVTGPTCERSLGSPTIRGYRQMPT